MLKFHCHCECSKCPPTAPNGDAEIARPDIARLDNVRPCSKGDDDDDDEGRINFSVALSPKTTRTRNNKPKQ